MTIVLVWIGALGTMLVALTEDPAQRFGLAALTLLALLAWTVLMLIV